VAASLRSGRVRRTLSKPGQFRVGVFGSIVVSIKLSRRRMALSGGALRMSENSFAKCGCSRSNRRLGSKGSVNSHLCVVASIFRAMLSAAAARRLVALNSSPGCTR
jgi:hypothetical protein